MVGSLNALLHEKEQNVFKFIELKLTFGVGEQHYYLTRKGEYIVDGSPFGNNWIEWAKDYGIDEEYGIENLEKCSKEITEELIDSYEDFKLEWCMEAGIKDIEELEQLELLHKQYLAISQYSENPNDENAIQTIVDTYSATGINVLKYLLSLKTTEEWHSMGDLQGSQLCAVLTGFDPRKDLYSEKRAAVLSKMHESFNQYIDQLDNIISKNIGPKK